MSTILNDQQIIANTLFEPLEDGEGVYMKITLPGDLGVYKQRAQSIASAQKHIIPWCNAVRNHMASMEQAKIDEMMAAKRRRQDEEEESTTFEEVDEYEAPKTPSAYDPKATVIEWYENTQEKIDELSERIKRDTAERDKLRNDRDAFGPIIAIWRGSE